MDVATTQAAGTDALGQVTVVGGGIAGMSLTYALQKAGADVVCLERHVRPGGKILTHRSEGFIMEGGPDTLLRMKPAGVALCHELGLGPKLVDTEPEAAVHIVVNGQLHRYPPGMRLAIPTDIRPFLTSGLISPAGRLRALLDLVLPPEGPEEATIAEVIGRRLGREVVDRVAQPLMAGIHGGDADELSLDATFPTIAQMAREGSLIRGFRRRSAQGQTPTPDDSQARTAFVSLEGGMHTLASALMDALGDRLRVAEPVIGVEQRKGPDSRPIYRVFGHDGYQRDSQALALATPAPASASLLASTAPHVARSLAGIPHTSTASVNLGFARDDVVHPLDGYGFLCAAGEPLFFRGCTWASSKLPGRAPDGHVLLRAFVGGRGREADVALDDDAMVERVMADLTDLLDIRGGPVISRVDRWPQGQPQFLVGHADKVASLRAACPPGLFLLGAALDGVGLPDGIAGGQAAAEEILTTIK